MHRLSVLVLVTIVASSLATTLVGEFDSSRNFFLFLNKFGFIKTDRAADQRATYGHIFGNVSTPRDGQQQATVTLAVLDRHHFLEFYGNRTVKNRDIACKRMFARLSATAYDAKCNPEGNGDYLRKIPCRGICEDEDVPSNVVAGAQFTFVINNINQPRFWYISIVSCFRNLTTCEWQATPSDHRTLIDYKIQFVNGNPIKEQATFFSPFVYHFSYDQQNILEQCLIFFVIYIFLVPIQIHGSRKQSHPVTKLFTMSIILEFISICFILIHLLRFASNGQGNEGLKITGEIFDILSRTSFMLILLLLAKGWAVTRLEISMLSWFALIVIWISYLTLNFVLYVWNTTEIDVIADVDEFGTWPGLLVLISRSCIMLWFLYELRTTMKYEHSTKKLDFLLHFGASSLVWFIYLPIIALISMKVSVFWRYKLLLSVTNSVDCLAYCFMMGLLWPNRSGQYLLLAGPSTAADELDEFNEAPHNVNTRNAYTDEIRGIDDDDDDDNDDIQILVRSENAITSSVHNNTADNLILIENGEATQHNGGSNSKKSKVFT